MKQKLIILLCSLLLLAAGIYYYMPQAAVQDRLPDMEAITDIRELAESAGLSETTGAPELVGALEASGIVGEKGPSEEKQPFSESRLPEHMLYYYELLTEEEQRVYRELYGVMDGHLDYTVVSTTDTESIGKIMDDVLLDNPQLFYIDSLKTQTTTIGLYVTVAVTAEENMSEEEQLIAAAAIENYKKACLLNLSLDMTTYDKALRIYEYVVTNLVYDKAAPYNQSLYSAALGASVCRGYASAYKYLCDAAGIPCIMVTGQMQGEKHAWNLVCIDGVWCQVDCTAADDLQDAGYEVDYSWFGGTDAFMQATHTADAAGILPRAESAVNSYYVRQGRYFDAYSLETLTALLATGTNFSFQCANAAVYDEYQREMGNSEDIARAVGQGKSVQFMGNGNTNTIYVEFR